MKTDKPSEKYVAAAKALSKAEAERMFARMRRRYARWMKEEKLEPVEAVALQIEYEEGQLQDWRDKIAKLKAKAE